APALAQTTIRWRMQTYAGPALAEHVVVPAIDLFNKIAGDRMQIELFFADQLVPTGELFQAMQRGTIDAVQSDDDSMASPTEVTVFGGYFPFASRYSLDVPVLFNQYGLNEIWDAEYAKVGVKHVSAGSWDPCHFATKDPINSLEDLKGKRVFTFPTAGRFLAQFGVVPVTLPWEDIEVAVQTGELDGIAWSGITEDYTVGWADVTDYFLTNNISGAWIGSWFANQGRWAELPDHLKSIVMAGIEAGHTYRNQWYWGGEAALRANGDKLELRSVPPSEWAEVENAAKAFWDEIAQEGEVHQKIIDIFREYNGVINQAGVPYNFE
ncbi:MAG: TRAP transporter substrate-binding protein, partial [Paracoccaceae bacterium]|nr:TRAP transporter substrate-binding protein [Paracoccaceae bacterium]